ncbi:MAG: GNAT family N-acetyltransferase [Pyrinomonadaceae bacterium]
MPWEAGKSVGDTSCCPAKQQDNPDVKPLQRSTAHSLHAPTPFHTTYDLAVDQNYRRRGVATGLISHLREIARELGSWVIFVQADPGDEPAIKLYESLGTREDVHHFDIRP